MYDFPPMAVKIALVACLYIFLMVAYRELYRTVKQTRPTAERPPETGLGERPVPQLVVVAAGDGSRMQVGDAFTLLHTTTLGRASDNTIVLLDNSVSKYHARIDYDGDRFVLTDVGSTNGTLLGGQLVRGPMTLAPGAAIRVGATALAFRA